MVREQGQSLLCTRAMGIYYLQIILAFNFHPVFSLKVACVSKVGTVIGKTIFQLDLEKKFNLNTYPLLHRFLYFMDNQFLSVDNIHY